MPTVFWYYGLAVIGVGTAAFTIYKKRNVFKISTLIVFYLFTASATWLGEFIVLGLFNSYAYKTGVFSDPWAQNILGHLILNSTMYPAAAVLAAAYSLRYGWISLITLFFLLAEYLFAMLGAYEQHWWKYYMSTINVVVFIMVSKYWFVKMNQKRYGLTRTTTFYFVAFVIFHIPAPLLLLFGKQYYNVGLVANMYRSSTIFILIYHLVECFLLVFFVCVLKKPIWKLAPFVIAFAGQGILWKMNILIFQNGWNLLYTTLIYVICLGTFMLLEKYSLKPAGG